MNVQHPFPTWFLACKKKRDTVPVALYTWTGDLCENTTGCPYTHVYSGTILSSSGWFLSLLPILPFASPNFLLLNLLSQLRLLFLGLRFLLLLLCFHLFIKLGPPYMSKEVLTEYVLWRTEKFPRGYLSIPLFHPPSELSPQMKEEFLILTDSHLYTLP